MLLRSRGTAREESHQDNRRQEGQEEQKFRVSHPFAFFDVRGRARCKSRVNLQFISGSSGANLAISGNMSKRYRHFFLFFGFFFAFRVVRRPRGTSPRPLRWGPCGSVLLPAAGAVGWGCRVRGAWSVLGSGRGAPWAVFGFLPLRGPPRNSPGRLPAPSCGMAPALAGPPAFSAPRPPLRVSFVLPLRPQPDRSAQSRPQKEKKKNQKKEKKKGGF